MQQNSIWEFCSIRAIQSDMTECREITLINYHIPMADEMNNEDVQYITLGFFDGMITKKIELNESNEKKLWQYELHRTAVGEGEYSYQNIACISCGEKCDYTDEELWKEDTDIKYPLTFVTFLQLEDYASDQNTIDSICLTFNAQVKQKMQNGMYYTYKTVDKNDFVVCIKCDNYKEAVKAIKMLHQIENGKIIYSYTVFSVSKKVLYSIPYDDFLSIFPETIDSICLKGIVNSSRQDANNSLDQKYKKFSEKLIDRLYQGEGVNGDAKIYDILGDNDFRLIARQVKLGKILREFGIDGLLNYQNDEFKKNLFSSSLVLNTDVDETLSDPNVRKSSGDEQVYSTPYCVQLETEMDWIFKKVEEMKASDFADKPIQKQSYWEILAAMCNGIWQLLQSLKALERPKTKKYDFWTIYIPLIQMVKILEDKVKSEKIDLILKYREEIYDFLHKMSMTLHGTLRTDIQFFQIRDFNAVIHYAPAKLRAFYALWALRLSDYYGLFCENNTGKTYSFILSPGMFPEMKVQQLFDDDDEQHRLMLITMPERQLYTLQNTCIMLGHEVSHFVGTDVKCRNERYVCLINICARIMALEMNSFRYHNFCRENHSRETEIELERLIAKSGLYERIRQLLLEENFVLEKIDPLGTELHSEITIWRVQSLFDLFTNTCFEMVWGEDCEYYFQNHKKAHLEECTEFEERKKVIRIAKSISYDIEENIKLVTQRFTGQLHSFLGRILDKVLREACADVSSILTLELMPGEYLESFSDSEMQYLGKEDDNILSEKDIRISLVIKSVQQGIIEYKSCFLNQDVFEEWRTFHIESFVEKCASGSKSEALGCKVYMCMEALKDNNSSIRHYGSAYNMNKGYFTGEVLDFYLDSVVWNEMWQYISLCVKEYLRQLSSDENKGSEKVFLAKTYKNILKNSIGMQIQIVEDFLKTCEKKFEKNIENIYFL